MTSELRVDKIHNEGGDNDSGLNLATNDNVKIDIAGSTKGATPGCTGVASLHALCESRRLGSMGRSRFPLPRCRTRRGGRQR